MRNVEIYIENTRLDLFDDETIQITDSIQDVKDIKKVFTAFSQTFKVPASDNNNKLFKHYYNADIDGYDGRFRKDAIIKLDGANFKKGRMRLNSVDLISGVPSTYNITFFGSTVQLTELLGEDELSDLVRNLDGSTNTTLSNYDFTYNAEYVKQRLTGTSNGSSIEPTLIFPFISAKNYYYADSNGNDFGFELPDGAESRNIHPATLTSTPSGIFYKDLKPAIKAQKIIEAIEERYNLSFGGDFFPNSESDVTAYEFTELYLWLHREKGQITEQLGKRVKTYKITDFIPDGLPQYTDDSVQTILDEVAWGVEVTITPDNSSDTYDLDIPESDDGAYLNQSGTTTKFFRFFNAGTFIPNITITSNGTLSDHTVDIKVEKYFWYALDGDWELDEKYEYVSIEEKISESTIASQMPKIKIIDFLTSLFKMFNLTTYFDGERLIVDTLDNYYAGGTSYDITKYVETSTTNVAKSNIYRNVAFEFAEAKTFAVYNSNLITGEEFGNENFEDRDLDGGVYKVEVKFEKMMYERMTDQVDGSDTVMQWGWFVDDNKNEYINKPLLLYAERVSNLTSLGDYLKFDDGSGVIYTSEEDRIDQYYRPLNVMRESIAGTQSLNFSGEQDEYTKQVNDVSLFNTYYSNYINDVFDKKARIYTFTAYLPSQILNRYKLNDTFIIAGREYRINKIKTNLINGKTELELINKL